MQADIRGQTGGKGLSQHVQTEARARPTLPLPANRLLTAGTCSQGAGLTSDLCRGAMHGSAARRVQALACGIQTSGLRLACDRTQPKVVYVSIHPCIQT